MSAEIIEFPKLKKCRECAGSGLTWSFQRRTKRAQVASSCIKCGGTGISRDLENLKRKEES